jgi:hypothetical protein
MTVHVDEIHTQVRAGAPGPAPAPDARAGQDGGDGPAGRPGLREDLWCAAESRVHRLRCRVSAEGFDD